MMPANSLQIACELEIRESGRLHGLLLTEGRASTDRRELFTPGAVEWPHTGIMIRPNHLQDAGAVVAYPYRDGAEIRVNITPSEELRESVESGAKYMSVEFRALEEETTDSGIREVTRALLMGAATVANPSYRQTSAELRERESGLNELYLLTL